MAAAILPFARTEDGLDAWLVINPRSGRVYCLAWHNLTGRTYRIAIQDGTRRRHYEIPPGSGAHELLRERLRITKEGAFGFSTHLSEVV